MGVGTLIVDLLQRLDARDSLTGAALIAASSAVEHVFPPAPGDLGVTLGAAVGFARGWPIALLFAAAIFGSLVGSSVTWTFGRWLERRSHLPKHPAIARAHDRVLTATAALDRHGLALVVGSRFVPGVRAFVVVAAGFRRMPLASVLAAAALGATLWNSLLFALAALVGHNLNALARWLDTYNRVALSVVIVIALAFGARSAWQRSRA